MSLFIVGIAGFPRTPSQYVNKAWKFHIHQQVCLLQEVFVFQRSSKHPIPKPYTGAVESGMAGKNTDGESPRDEPRSYVIVVLFLQYPFLDQED